MRIAIGILSAILLLSMPVKSAEIQIESKVSSVGLHPDGMRVYRQFKLDLPKGRHRVEFLDVLPADHYFAEALLGSIQINFDDPKVIIRSFSLREIELKPDDLTTLSSVKIAYANLLEAQKTVWDLEEGRQDAEARVKAAKAQIAYLDSIRVSSDPNKAPNVSIIEDISANSIALGKEYRAAILSIKNGERELEKGNFNLGLNKEILKTRSLVWEELVSRHSTQSAIYFDIETPEPFRGSGTISSLSVDGNWQANYILHLVQNGANSIASLQRRAVVAQVTPDDWKSVNITLSTAKIFIETSVNDPNRKIGDVRKIPKTKRNASSEGALSQPMMEPVVMEEHSSQSIGLDYGPEFEGQILKFELPVPLRLDSKEKAIVSLDTLNLDVELLAKIAPSRTDTAFLIAKLENRTGGSLLPGSVSIYRNGMYVGDGELPSVGIGEEFELSFGEYDGIEVKRELIARLDSDVGILSSSNRRVLTYRTTISNHFDVSMPIRVVDGIPVSENEKLVIKMISTPKPTKLDIDGKKGVVMWQFELPSNQSEFIDFGYDAQWPPDMLFVIK